ncbi:hypothetical protein ACZ90_08695 [Streptomyces albus subsp. albus]|nr:hypothetical protein ACZ90_08695 [Streptomyces albus subsp. albus]
MGYWGWIVVAKGDESLAAHPAVAAFGGEVLAEYAMGEWREIWLDEGSAEHSSPEVSGLVAATGAPALAIYVADEDCAVMDAAAPSGAEWTGVFAEERAREYQALPAGYRRADAVAGALAWAAEAGLMADRAGVERALAEGWYSDLLEAFGIPERIEVE